MKITTRNIMRALRLYGLSSEDAPMRDIKNLIVHDFESYIRADFVLHKQKYALLFGSVVNIDELDELWPEMPDTAEILPNPLDESGELETPFQGKYLILIRLKPQTMRLDQFLSTQFDASRSRSQWQKHIKAGHITVNGQPTKSASQEVTDTDDIAVEIPAEEQGQEVKLNILFEDNDVIVVNKPRGLLTHAKGGIISEQTLADALRDKTSFGLDTDRPGIVHRLDRDTSGVIIAAKNEEAAKFLQAEFAKRRAKKTYLAITSALPKHPKALIDLPIGRHPQKPSTFRVDPSGKSAETYYKTLDTNDQQALLKLQPKTGRTHQLRVHLAHLGAPILGDIVYGQADQRLFLHAWKLTINLPSAHEKTFTAPIPEEFIAKFPSLSEQE